jgi:acyl carrier protein
VREETATRLVAAEALLPFDLTVGPLFRATLVRMDADRHLLLVTFHHSITDGGSLRIFYEELGAFYLEAVTGAAPALPALPVQYADYAAWQRERLRGEVLERMVAHWRQRLAGAPAALDMPFDRPRPPVQTYGGTSQLLEVGAEAVQTLRAFARDESVTLFMILIAAWATLVQRLTGEDDVVLGTPTANRPHPELEPLVGFFANTMPLRVDLSGDPTFRELAGRVRTVVLADFAHEELPFEKVVEELKPERDLSHHPIYQMVIALETSSRPDQLDLPGLRLAPLPPTEGTAKYDVALYMNDRGGRLAGLFEANRDLVDRSTAERWLSQFTALATAGAGGPARRLSELSLLRPGEQIQILGRTGERVKIRRYRVDLQTVEAALAAHPAVGSVVVIPRAGRSGEEQLVAYATARPDGSVPGPGELRGFLSERLPKYMLPGAFVSLDVLPLTAKGEIDRNALPAPEESAAAADGPMMPNEGAGRIVAEIWQELLKVERVDPRDNFFALGGHSLLLLPMQERIRERFGVNLPVVELFKFPTAGALADHLHKLQEASRQTETPPDPVMTKVQERAARSRTASRDRFAEARRRTKLAGGSEPVPEEEVTD